MALTLPTTKHVPVYGSIIRFAPEGETIEAVTVAKDTMPAGAVFDDWEDIGCVEEASVQIESEAGEVVHCFDATTGEYEELQTENEEALNRLILEITLQKVTPYILQMAMGAASVDGADGTYTPGAKAAFKGWIKVQTQTGTELVNVLDLWVEIKISEAANIARRAKGWKPKISVRQLKAADDAGAFGTTS